MAEMPENAAPLIQNARLNTRGILMKDSIQASHFGLAHHSLCRCIFNLMLGFGMEKKIGFLDDFLKLICEVYPGLNWFDHTVFGERI